MNEKELEEIKSIESPITGISNVTLEGTISSQEIISCFQKCHQVDVSSYFKGIQNVKILKCLDTGYKFYYPHSLQGRGDFYASLQEASGENYYMEWRWEHERAYSLVSKNHNVLEIGCGKGVFLERLKKENISSKGLEFNEEAKNLCIDKGLKVKSMSIQELAHSTEETFDVICMFQVLEHVAEVKSFLDAVLKLLAPNGKLLFSVPNMDSFLKNDKTNCLNMPPHHMGLWEESAIGKLGKYFPIRLQTLYREPLQFYHFGPYYRAFVGQNIKDNIPYIGGLVSKIIKFPFCLFLLPLRNKTKGMAMLGVFEKVQT